MLVIYCPIQLSSFILKEFSLSIKYVLKYQPNPVYNFVYNLASSNINCIWESEGNHRKDTELMLSILKRVFPYNESYKNCKLGLEG